MNLSSEQFWQIVGALAGIVGAVAAVVGLARTKVGQPIIRRNASPGSMTGTGQYLFFLLIGTLGWSLCVLAFVWFFEPFGSFISSNDYKKIYAAILAFPALGLLRLASFFLPSSNSKKEEL